MIISKNTAEITAYDTLQKNYKKRNKTSKKGVKTRQETYIQSYYRAKNNIRRYIDCNFTNNSQFITLTYHRNETNKTTVDSDRKMLLRKLRTIAEKRRRNNLPFYWLCVYEKQHRGAYHIHLITNRNFSYDEIDSVWKNGFFNIKKIRNIEHVGAYISKYLGKELKKNNEYYYYHSKNLIKPSVIYTNYPPAILKIKPRFTKKKYNIYRNNITYMLFSLKDFIYYIFNYENKSNSQILESGDWELSGQGLVQGNPIR